MAAQVPSEHSSCPTDGGLVSWPAQWEEHRAVWLAWPVNQGDFKPKLSAVVWVYTEIVRALAREGGDEVRILVANEAARSKALSQLARAGVDLSCVVFVEVPTDRSWTRDYLPFVVRDGQGRGLSVRFGFTGWARYGNHALDAEASGLVQEYCREHDGLEPVAATWDGDPLVLEGGALDTNGQGTVLATEECLLDSEVQVRNPGLDRQGYEAALDKYLGARKVVWLGRGIVGDDTHGHVDDVCRFVGPSILVLCQEANPADENYRSLEENRERLESARTAQGERIEVIGLPMPAPLYFEGQRLPASYANFFIGQSCVLVPTFNDPSDRQALGILGECFPGREVRGVHCVDLILGLGALHCLTKEQALV